MIARWVGFAFMVAGWVGLMMWLQPPPIVNILISAAFGFIAMTWLQRVYR